jgi:hypothetical protein
MRVRVKLRFNKLTGEVEEFLVDDQDLPRLPAAEHNRQHDRIAAEVGGVLERHPAVTEVLPGQPTPAVPDAVTDTPVIEAERLRR